MKSGKREPMKRIEQSNQENTVILGEKENYMYLWILEADSIKQMEMR